MPPLELTINLAGTLTSALEKSNKALGETEQGTKRAKKEVDLFEGSIGRLSGSFGGLEINLGALAGGGALFAFSMAEAGKLAFESIKRVTEVVVDLGKEIVVANGKAQDLDLALKLNLGEEGKGQAKSMAGNIAKHSRFDDDEILRAQLPLFEQGITDQALMKNLTLAATDIAARRAEGAEGVANHMQALGRIALKGEVDQRMLRELAISQADYFKGLGGLLHVTAAQAEQANKEGKVAKETLLAVALDQIAQREGGALGNATEEAGKNLGGTLKRLDNLKENLFKGLVDSPGMKAVQGFLDNFIQTVGGDIGTDLVQKVGGAFESVFSDLSGPAGLDKMKVVIGDIAGRVGGLVSDFREAWPTIQAGAQATLEVVSNIAHVMETMSHVLAKIASIYDRVRSFNNQFVLSKEDFIESYNATSLGKLQPLEPLGSVPALGNVAGPGGATSGDSGAAALAEWHKDMGNPAGDAGNATGLGFAGGLLDSIPAVRNAAEGLALATINTVRDGLDIHSPSGVTFDLGSHAAEGFAMGLDDGTSDTSSAARRALIDTVIPQGPSSAFAGGSGGSDGSRAGLTVGDININVTTGSGDGSGSPDQIAQAVRVELMRTLEEAGRAFGVGA